MDLHKMLKELRSEHSALGEAINVIERLARGQGKRRGRPPKWMSQSAGTETKTTAKAGTGKRRKFSAETRAKMAASQKKRWAAVRGTKAHAASA